MGNFASFAKIFLGSYFGKGIGDSYTLNSPYSHQCAPHLGEQGGGDIDLKTPGNLRMI
jgi:hypothetical protein